VTEQEPPTDRLQDAWATGLAPAETPSQLLGCRSVCKETKSVQPKTAASFGRLQPLAQ